MSFKKIFQKNLFYFPKIPWGKNNNFIPETSEN